MASNNRRTEIELPSTAGRHVIHLEKDQFVSDPASTRRHIQGPCSLEVCVYLDGGINLKILSMGNRG